MHQVVVPQLFENMEEATVGSWLVAPDQEVSEGQPLCELITEKTTLELPSPASGTVRCLVVPAKAVVPRGGVIALIGAPDEALPEIEPPLVQAPVVEAPKAESAAPIAEPKTASTSSGGRLRATPAARRLARELGVELELVAAQNGGKVVSEDDVRAFSEGQNA